jgi:trimethylamine--corrinoid protein Co-methyltransferase
MAQRGFVRSFEPLQVLSEQQVEAIHKSALDVLAVTGVRFEHEQALKLLADHGAKVDFREKRVRIPPGLVEECLRRCPSSFRIKARDPKNDLLIGGNTLYFGTFPGMQSLDLATWERRGVSRSDYYDGVTVLDALENLHFISNYCPYFGFEGLPPAMAIPEGVAAVLRNSSKCLATGCQDESERFTIEMAQELGTDILGQCTCSSPLVYNHGAIESTYRVVNSDNPIHVISGLVMGGTGPATIAGSLVTNTAELMAGVTLIQLIKPGARVMVTDFVMPQDMRTGSPAFGAIGNSLHQVAFSQVWRKYRIPTKTSLPGPSSSKKIDYQCGYEKAVGAFSAALAGFHAVFVHGCVYGELTFHPVQAILDDDLAGMIGRFVEGVEVTTETLAVELIEEVGPIPGFFLDKEHTRKWWKKEQFLPKASDRMSYPEWMKTGKKDCVAYARETMDRLLATHKVSIPLTEDQNRRLGTVLEGAYAYYKSKGLA